MPAKPAIPHPANKVILLKMSLPPVGIFLDESLFIVALEITDEIIPPAESLVAEVLAEDAVVVEVPEMVELAAAVTFSVSPAAPVGTGCPII